MLRSNPDMPYEFLLYLLHPDAPFHPFHDGLVPYQHPDQLEEEHVPEPIPEWDIPVEKISVSLSELSFEELHTTSISGLMSVGQSSSTSAKTPPEEYSDVIEIFF
ncbi:hypothetical protein AHAS_Ahas13G0255800 [Arachis hypogaea]